MDQAESKESTRREFCAKMLLGAAGVAYGATILYPIGGFLARGRLANSDLYAEKSVNLKADDVPPGSSLMFRMGPDPGLLIHFPDGSWAAYNARCTHLNCTVLFEADKNRILCACHEGYFDPATGVNLSGPPPSPLERFTVEIEGADIVVSRVEG